MISLPSPSFKFSNARSKDFIQTTCSDEKLEIINSMENMYFHAQFLGCSQSDAEYCFVQVMTLKTFQTYLVLLIEWQG